MTKEQGRAAHLQEKDFAWSDCRKHKLESDFSTHKKTNHNGLSIVYLPSDYLRQI